MKTDAIRMARKCTEDGNLEGALSIMEKAIVADPSNPVLIIYKGQLLLDLSREEDAEKEFKRALKLDPKNPYAWGHLGLLMQSREEFERAAFCFQRVVEEIPDHNTLTILANVQLAFDPESALLNAEKALQCNPEWEEAKEVLRTAKKHLRENKK